MGAYLKEDVNSVRDDQEDGCDTGDVEDSISDVSSGRACGRSHSSVERRRDDETETAERKLASAHQWSQVSGSSLRCQQEIASHLTNFLVEFLLSITDTSHDKTHSKTEQLRGQDGSQNGGLDDLILTLRHKYHEHHNLDHRAKGRLQQDSDDLVQLPS